MDTAAARLPVSWGSSLATFRVALSSNATAAARIGSARSGQASNAPLQRFGQRVPGVEDAGEVRGEGRRGVGTEVT